MNACCDGSHLVKDFDTFSAFSCGHLVKEDGSIIEQPGTEDNRFSKLEWIEPSGKRRSFCPT